MINGGKTITRGDLEKRWGRRTEGGLSLEEWTEKYYGDYRILDLPVNVQSEPNAKDLKERSTSGEARESTKPDAKQCHRDALNQDSRGGQKLFDREAYQRLYMKKWRLRQKLKKLAAEKDAMGI